MNRRTKDKLNRFTFDNQGQQNIEQVKLFYSFHDF